MSFILTVKCFYSGKQEPDKVYMAKQGKDRSTSILYCKQEQDRLIYCMANKSEIEQF